RRILVHQDVGGAVVVEVACAVDLPGSANCPHRLGGLHLHRIGAHHQVPQRHRSSIEIDLMLQDVGGAIPIEVAGAVHLPVRTVHPDGGVRHHGVVVHYHHFEGPLAGYVAMHQDVAGAIVVEVGHGIHDPIRSAHGDLELSLYPARVHLIDQKLPRRGGRIINVNEEVG